MNKVLSTVLLLSASASAFANPFTRIPEPEMLSLFGLGIASMLLVARRRKKA